MALENFSELLQKLKMVHEREVEGWQERVAELSYQKSCDAKRIEELFSKNQQLREQQKLLTENIKQLENRLRAGLCDRCTVTQDVAKRKQQEFESSQIQSLHHITVLVNEMNAVKKENKRLQEELKNLRRFVNGQNGHSSQEAKTACEVFAAGKGSRLTEVSTVLTTIKGEPDHNHSSCAEEKLAAFQKAQRWDLQEPCMPRKVHTSISPNSTRPRTILLGEKSRARSMDMGDLLASPTSPLPHPPSPQLMLKNLPFSVTSFSPSPVWDEKPPPVHQSQGVYRPRPIKTARLSVPWSLPDHPEWAPLLIPTALLERSRALAKMDISPSQPLDSSHPIKSKRGGTDSPSSVSPSNRKRSPGQAERNPEVKHADPLADAPLDLSDPKRCTSVQNLSPTIQKGSTVEGSDVKMHLTSSSSSTPSVASSPPTTCPTLSPQQGETQQDPQGSDTESKPENGLNSKQLMGDKQKKVPVLTISIQPVVVLQSVKGAMEKEELSDSEANPENHTEAQSEDASSPERSQNGLKVMRQQASDKANHQQKSPTEEGEEVTVEQLQADQEQQI